MQYLGLIILLIGAILSIRERKLHLMWRSSPTQSPLSKALSQLVGTAGGIYLSLELLFSFLKVPENWLRSWAFSIEPLALLSLVLAIIQPFVIKIWLKIKR